MRTAWQKSTDHVKKTPSEAAPQNVSRFFSFSPANPHFRMRKRNLETFWGHHFMAAQRQFCLVIGFGHPLVAVGAIHCSYAMAAAAGTSSASGASGIDVIP